MPVAPHCARVELGKLKLQARRHRRRVVAAGPEHGRVPVSCVSPKQPIHGPNQLPKGIAVKQPELTQLIGLQDGDGDRLFISRLDRPDGPRGYLLAIRSGEVHGGVSLTAGDLDRLSTVIRHEVGEGDDGLMAEFRFFARAIWLLIFCALMSLLLFAVTGPLFAYPWSN